MRRKINLSRRLLRKRRQTWFRLGLLLIASWILLSLFLNLIIRLPANLEKPVDAILVLGGSIQREVEAAKIARRDSTLPIIISQGSGEPCSRIVFQQQQAPTEGVWLENCAQSTFGNFFFSSSILRRWDIHKVQLITSARHLPRAEWLAKIHLGAQGIAVEVNPIQEVGIPGNHESVVKTAFDVTRSLIWSLMGQIIQPPCNQVIQLSDVDMSEWQKKGFHCERQVL